MAKSDLYKMSGHWDHYKDGMFVIGDEEKDDEVFALRPMTCPFNIIYIRKARKAIGIYHVATMKHQLYLEMKIQGDAWFNSYKTIYSLRGHIVCTPEQVEEEIRASLDLIQYIMTTLGIIDKVSFRFQNGIQIIRKNILGQKKNGKELKKH